MMVKLKDQGHRVLIYSQFQHMLDLLEDYCTYKVKMLVHYIILNPIWYSSLLSQNLMHLPVDVCRNGTTNGLTEKFPVQKDKSELTDLMLRILQDSVSCYPLGLVV